MKIVMFGDSITDMRRERDCDGSVFSYGNGYVFLTAGELLSESPIKYEIINRGISGHRVTDLYARIKSDVWNFNPDVLSILIGVNDVWHEIAHQNGVEIDRFEKVYKMLIEDTLKRLPNVKIMILEPFVLKGTETEAEYDKFLAVKEYAKVAKRVAEEYNLIFVPLQDAFDKATKNYDSAYYLHDGVHPNVAGAKLISNAWIKAFKENIEK